MKLKDFVFKDSKLAKVYIQNGVFRSAIDTIDADNGDLKTIVAELQRLSEDIEDLNYEILVANVKRNKKKLSK